MPSFRKSTVLAAIAGAVTVAAHGHVSKITIDGTSYDGFDPTSAPYGPQPESISWSNGASDNGYVASSALQDPDIICHLDATNAALTAPVAAGGDVAITWNQWAESHHGPVINYLADCGGNCSTVDKTTLKWFKIEEVGQLELGAGSGTTGKWGDDLLFDNDLTWTVTIPSSIKAGNYVLRHELIALHSAGEVGGAQMYPQCINLEVTGSGTQSPDGVVGTELYTSTDPGIEYNIYNDETHPTYEIPGPAMPDFGSGSGSGSGETQPTTTESPAVTSTPPAQQTTASPTVAASSTFVTSATQAATTTSAPSEPVVTQPSASQPPSPAPHKGCSGKKRRSHRHDARHAKEQH